MNYFLIRYGLESKVQGPANSWQDAVLAAFGCIDGSMLVKNLGSNSYYVRKTSFIHARLHEPNGWFTPMIRNQLGLTMVKDEAWGPPELSAYFSALITRMRAANTLEALKLLHDESIPCLRFLPVELAAQCNVVYNDLLKRFD